MFDPVIDSEPIDQRDSYEREIKVTTIDELNSINDTNHPAIYQVKVKGRIEEDWSEWFEGMQIEFSKDETGKWISTLTGLVSDLATLEGILPKIEMKKPESISVSQIKPSSDA